MPNRSQADIKLSDIGLWEVRTALNPFCFQQLYFFFLLLLCRRRLILKDRCHGEHSHLFNFIGTPLSSNPFPVEKCMVRIPNGMDSSSFFSFIFPKTDVSYIQLRCIGRP